MNGVNYKTFVSTIVEKGGKVLMVQEGKNNHGQRGKWNFPAGHLEAGESIIEAAVRETKEETGYDIKIDGLAAVFKHDFNDALGIIFFFTGSLINDEPCGREEEMMAVEWVSTGEVADLDLRFDEISLILNKLNRDGAYPLDIFLEKEDK